MTYNNGQHLYSAILNGLLSSTYFLSSCTCVGVDLSNYYTDGIEGYFGRTLAGAWIQAFILIVEYKLKEKSKRRSSILLSG